MISTGRARKIVRMAAEQVETPSTKDWILADRLGTWETRARLALESTAGKAAAWGLSEDEVDRQVAIYLASVACTAALFNAAR